jgi:hypothetical protein
MSLQLSLLPLPILLAALPNPLPQRDSKYSLALLQSVHTAPCLDSRLLSFLASAAAALPTSYTSQALSLLAYYANTTKQSITHLATLCLLRYTLRVVQACKPLVLAYALAAASLLIAQLGI